MNERILVTGSRDWDDVSAVFTTLNKILKAWGKDITIVHGACPTGADDLASRWAVQNGIPEEKHPAQWNIHGKKAGYLRNAEMASLGADICVSFHKGNSPGTAMMMGLARKQGIPVHTVTMEGAE